MSDVEGEHVVGGEEEELDVGEREVVEREEEEERVGLEELKAMGGRHLVLGHSNTTPGMVRALGGDPGSGIEEMEYDRLYIVTVTDDGVSTVLIRFGAPYEG